jgi:hypothetical protein
VSTRQGRDYQEVVALASIAGAAVVSEGEMRTRMDKGGLPCAILNNQLLKAMTMQTKTVYEDRVRRQR